jgi:hypothetical protein
LLHYFGVELIINGRAKELQNLMKSKDIYKLKIGFAEASAQAFWGMKNETWKAT